MLSCADGKVSIPLIKSGPRASWSRSHPKLPQNSTTSTKKPLPIFPAMRAGLTLLIKVRGFPGCNPAPPAPERLKNNDSSQCYFWSC